MKKSASITPAEGLRTWQDVIDQHPQDRAITPTARRNRVVHWAVWGTSIFALVVLMLVGFWALRAPASAPDGSVTSPIATPLQKLVFATDGVLTEGWAWKYLKIQAGDSLSKLDIFTLRQKLLELKQIKDVTIARELPGTLRIKVEERRPWLRIAADNRAGGYSLALVARDGTVFEGQDYPDAVLNQLPWLAGATLHRAKEGGYEPVAGMDAVAELLSTAQSEVPRVAAQWTVVDLSQYDPRPEAPVLSSLIKVRSVELGELTFLDHNFQSQIQRLALVVHDLEQKAVLMRGLDLSIDNQVVVEMATLPASTPTRRLH